jgi:D-hexose-6-phosphate mutarotase
MNTTTTDPANSPIAPGRVSFQEGKGDLPMLEVTTQWSTAEIYLHGAHVTHFKKNGEPQLLFLSQCSRFQEGQPIRGGIPLVFPWFGPREGQPQHGFARTRAWELKEIVCSPDGSVSIRLSFPDTPEAATLPAFSADYVVTVKDTLNLEMAVKNKSTSEVFAFENCFHTYFEVADINAVTITGLKGKDYLDRVAHYTRKTDQDDVIKVAAELDRTYLDTPGRVEILDRGLVRKISIEKKGSDSTVVWNPWIAKAQQMPDFGNDEYQRMVCVESGNVATNQISLQPGASAVLSVTLRSEALA